MIKLFKKHINSLTRKRLAENFISLSVLQGLNYILPLITLPYLVRVLGPEKFGLIAFVQALIQYFIILTNYGFNLSATRQISINRENTEKVAEIFSSVMIIRFILGILSFIILAIILVLIPKFRQDSVIYIYTFGMVVGNILFPVWFFQGMEKMKYITIINIISRSIFTICIFIFIKRVEDYLYVPLINSFGSIIAGALSLRIVFKDFKIKLKIPRIKSIKTQFREGWHIFISSMAISLYTTSNVFILGLFTNNTIVGYYSAAEKLIKAVKGLINPVSQTIYPYISKVANESKQRVLVFIRKMVVFIGSGFFIISLLIFIFSNIIVNIVLGEDYHQSIVVLRILAFLPFIICLSNIFAVQGLYAFGLQHLFTKFVIPIAILHLCILSFLTYYFSIIGTAAALIITEVLITTFSIKYFYKFILKEKNL